MTAYWAATSLMNSNRTSLANLLILDLVTMFPRSTAIKNLEFYYHYQHKEYETASSLYEEILEIDPFIFENSDLYSNILFVLEKRFDLHDFAIKCFKKNPHRAETYCIQGNYHSINAERNKSIENFNKALEIDENCTNAWILLGHEYLENKMLEGAIYSYKKSLKIDEENSNAWYGLGQAYEILEMYQLAETYFSKAIDCNPKDSRIWTSLAYMYEIEKKTIECIKCHEIAIELGDQENFSILKCGLLYKELNRDELAIEYFERHISKVEGLEDCKELTKEMNEAFEFMFEFYGEKGDMESIERLGRIKATFHDVEKN